MESENREREQQACKLQEEKQKRRMEREEKRRKKRLELVQLELIKNSKMLILPRKNCNIFQKKSSLCKVNQDFFARQIELEERKLLVAQRKLESIRILDEILERVKVIWPFNQPLSVILNLFQQKRNLLNIAHLFFRLLSAQG